MHSDLSDSEPLAISAPGGPARHFRVQVRNQTRGGWCMHATFGEASAAGACLLALLQQGVVARLVRYGYLPTAA